MLGNLRSRFTAILAATFLAGQSLAQRFNTNITAAQLPKLALPFEVAPPRKRPFSTGIKGIKGTNNTRYGAGLREHFNKQRRREMFGVL